MKKKKRKLIQAEVVNLHPAMRTFIQSFIDSNPRLNYVISELHRCITYSGRNTFIFGKDDLLYRGVTNKFLPDFQGKRQLECIQERQKSASKL